MENNKQTAVEWYKERLKHRFLNGDTEESIYEKAKEMEKEQHIKTATHFFPTTLKREHFEHYYNETFNK